MSIANLFAVDFDPGIARPRRVLALSERASQQAFFGVFALVSIVSAGVMVFWGSSMSNMGRMPMPGHWTMSMAWMRMPGQTWIGAAASFLAMWLVMTAAMMMPSLAPMLWRYRNSVLRTPETPLGRLTTVVAMSYFFAWTLFGLIVFPLGVASAAIEMQQPMVARAVPIMAGVIVLIAGVLQFTKWKAHHLACCREAPGRKCVLPANPVAAWKLGLQFGFHCGISCANLTVVLLVLGIMDLRAMAAVTTAITAERLAPGGQRAARTVGAIVAAAGLLLIVRAVKPMW
jgi:predicted metal-binding membrane protein